MIALIFPFAGELEAFLTPGESAPAQAIGPLKVLAPTAKPRWRLAVSGQGKVETALACQILADRLSTRAFFLLGSATALDPSLKVGDIVLADPCIEWDFSGDDPGGRPTFRTGSPPPAVPEVTERLRSGPVLSGDRNVFEPAEKAVLRERYQALALAWEGAGFHRFLRKNGLLGWEVRLITEEAGEGRPPLPLLKERLAAGFPLVRKLVEALF